MTEFVLAHSPHGGSFTWEPVATTLRARGHTVTIPEYPEHPTAPFWRQHLDAIARLIQGERSVVVAHSGTGPLLAHAHAPRPFRAVYVDAGFRKRLTHHRGHYSARPAVAQGGASSDASAPSPSRSAGRGQGPARVAPAALRAR